MNVVKDRPAAKWLPSRHRYALARLIAYVALLAARPKAPDVDHIILTIDRDQSNVEHYTIALWYLVTVTCFLGAVIPPILALPLVLIVIQIPIYAFGLPFNDRRAVSAGYILCGAAAAAYFAMQPTWLRFVAYGYFGVLALNAVAFVVMGLLRGRVREAEARCVA